MAGAYDRLMEGRPTDADREWLSWLYGEYLNRIAPIAPEQEEEIWRGNGPCAYCGTLYGEPHYPSCDRPSVYRGSLQVASGGGEETCQHGRPLHQDCFICDEASPSPQGNDGLIERRTL